MIREEGFFENVGSLFFVFQKIKLIKIKGDYNNGKDNSNSNI